MNPSDQPTSVPPEPAQQQTEPSPAAAQPAAGDKLPSAFSLFKPSWQAVRLNLVTLIAIYLLFSASIAATFMATGLAYVNNHTLGLGVGAVLGLVSLVIAVISSPALAYTTLKGAQGAKVSFGESLSIGKRFALRWLLLTICAGFLIVVGLILLIVPGLIMIRRYFLMGYVLLDQDLGVFDTMRTSAALTKPHAGAVWDVVGVTILIQLPQIIPLIGPIIAIVLTVMYYCAPAIRYEQLRALGSQPPEPVPALSQPAAAG